ncbi:MAG TPA: tetratricopeptide repeat protein, partial [Polyangiaceae bacterium LLY-WYZ-15_(1-7)]|nr:tetratricopeptide repeat protein [Polyangiaceae bacterium LLY-WYZ-15_(1-7)]
MRAIGLLALAWALAGCPGGASEDAQGEETVGDEDIMFPDEAAAAEAPRHPATETVAAGERALAAGEVDEAEALFRQAVEEDAEDPRAQLDLGLVLELQNDYREAEAAYRAALRIDPDFVEALNNLGLMLRDLDRKEEAIAMLRHAVEVEADHGEAWLNLALALEETGDDRGAREAYRAAVRLQPRSAVARANLGLLLLRVG